MMDKDTLKLKWEELRKKRQILKSDAMDYLNALTEYVLDTEGSWKIDRVEAFYHHSARFQLTYQEITYWYNPETLERKETCRVFSIMKGEEWRLPNWAKAITNYNKNLSAL